MVQSFTELQNKFTLTNQEFSRYLQLKIWIIENSDLHYDLVPGRFEDVLFKEGKKKQLIGRIYNTLLKEQSKLYDKWNKDLQSVLSFACDCKLCKDQLIHHYTLI